MFNDRADAARQLAKALTGYSGSNVVVLGIPRGGVEVAFHVAKALHADFSVVVVRKLGYPENPETAFGAIAEDGSVFLSEEAGSVVSKEEMTRIINAEKAEIQRRIKLLRKDKPLPDLSGRTVIIVDDGIATGATLFSALFLCRKRRPAKIIVAAPVASQRMENILKKQVDGVVILEKPVQFYAVGQGYRHFENLSDEQTTAFIQAWENDRLQNAS